MARRQAPPPFEIMSRNWQSSTETFRRPAPPPPPGAAGSDKPDPFPLGGPAEVTNAGGATDPAPPIIAPDRDAPPRPIKLTRPAARAKQTTHPPAKPQQPAPAQGAHRRAQPAARQPAPQPATRPRQSIAPDGPAVWDRLRAMVITFSNRARQAAQRIINKAPVTLRVPRGYLIGTAAAALVIVLIAYWLGHERGEQEPTPASPTDRNLAALKRGPGATADNRNPSAAFQPPRTNPGPDNAANPGPGTDAAMPQPRPRLVRGKADPREENKHYFIMATYSVGQDQYVTPLLEFLWSKGVEAAAFNDNNSRSYYKVVALRGFTTEQVSRGEADDYKAKVLAEAGKAWKAADSRNSDFSDAYPVRYKGQDVIRSITKANSQ